MAVARKCDRCGCYRDGRIHKITYTPPHYLSGLEEAEHDLCNECIDDFNKFMEGVKPENLIDRLRSRMNKKE